MITPEKMTLGEVCRGAEARYKKRPAFRVFSGGVVREVASYRDWGRRARNFAARLVSFGLLPGSRVMILAENCPGWSVAYFGTALAGMVSVPVLTDFSPAQIANIAVHAGISACCVTGETAEKAMSAIQKAEAADTGANPASVPVIFIDRREDPEDDSAPEFRGGTGPEPDDLASIIYTSGTTGASKGVMLSHRNLVSCAAASRSFVKIYPRDRLLSVIPLAHAYECTLGLITPVMSGASVTYLDKPPSQAVLMPALEAVRPTAMVTVPLFIEKIYRRNIAPALAANPLFRFPPARPLALFAAGRKLAAVFGKSIRFFGTGGAPLSAETEDFLRKIKFPYAPGYGLTEAAPLIAGTGPFRFPIRSSGSILKGVEIRLDGEGEIQVKGPNIMMGYYRDEERTRDAFTPDGWFKTGDLGFMDRKGHLYIRGRLKNIILGPSGENIYPEEIEGLLTSSTLVEDALVRPGEKGEIVALVVLSETAKNAANVLGNALEELKKMVNRRLAAFSRLSRIEIRTEPFEKTPTRKIRRFLYN
ncbi:MAG: AMP-binding protein [Treponema sp.]|jgi:long-chain acyl-CoA synthetase|nr:AMP-binding protein [Treponema sp.]